MEKSIVFIVLLCLAITLTFGACHKDDGQSGVLKDVVESWKLNDGGTGTSIAPELETGTAGKNTWGVWLSNETFGRSLDFSTEKSNVFVENSKVELGKKFAISAWIYAPIREEADRVIVSQGTMEDKNNMWKVFLDGNNNHALAFAAEGLTVDGNSGVGLADGHWHHVLVSCSGKQLSYYIDGSLANTVSVSGEIEVPGKNLYIGSDPITDNGFDGTIAELRIYDKAKTPAEVTDTVLLSSDNEVKGTFLPLSHGIAIDRRQYLAPEPLPSEGQTVTEKDIVNCINMGFDHVKILLTPNHLIGISGELLIDKMAYITRVIDYVKKYDYRCILCIHPEGDFKNVYLGSLNNFENLCRWYGELAAYIGEHWGPETVAIQLMTEPANNSTRVSWSWMSDRMWGAVRNVLPQHTILTSANRWGNIEYLKFMSPATDSNLVYTFTTYEPYTIGWYYYNTNYGSMDAWSYVHDIPYPVEEGVDYSEAIENAIDQVPEQMKNTIRTELWAYVKGEYDGKRTDMINNYDSLYNAEWHMLRAKSLDDWSKSYGGNIHIMCVEFGCMDADTPAVLWNSAAPCYGISPETRLQFVKDMRASFDAYGIGWDYWSYNEAHTVFRTDTHVYGTSPSPARAVDMFDYDMLTVGLGVTPLAEPILPDYEESEDDFIANDPSWYIISDMDSTEGWWGTDVMLDNGGVKPGSSYFLSGSFDANQCAIFCTKFEPAIDISDYAEGYFHIWLFVEDLDKVVDGQIELCTGAVSDVKETAWNVRDYLKTDGWNELYLPLTKTNSSRASADLSNIGLLRIYVKTTEYMDVGIDRAYFCLTLPD